MKNLRLQEWLERSNRLVDQSIAELQNYVASRSRPDELERYSNSTSKKIEGHIKSTRWNRRAERVPRKLEREEQTRKAKPSAESRSVGGTL